MGYLVGNILGKALLIFEKLIPLPEGSQLCVPGKITIALIVTVFKICLDILSGKVEDVGATTVLLPGIEIFNLGYIGVYCFG